MNDGGVHCLEVRAALHGLPEHSAIAFSVSLHSRRHAAEKVYSPIHVYETYLQAVCSRLGNSEVCKDRIAHRWLFSIGIVKGRMN